MGHRAEAARDGSQDGLNRKRASQWSILLVVVVIASGCYNPAVSIDRRSAMEQQLTRSAIWRAVGRLAIHTDALEGPWKVEVVTPDVRETDWVRLALEQRLRGLGVDLRDPDDPEASVVTVGVVHAGTDIDNFYVGLPIPGSGGMAFAFYQSITERGRAEMFLAFRAADGAAIATSDVVRGDAHFTDVYVLTLIGPFAFTDLDIDTSTRFTELGVDAWREAGERGEWVMPAKKPSEEDGQR